MTVAVKYILWGAIAFLALALFGITLEYLSFNPQTNFLARKQDVVFDSIWRPAFYIHVFSSLFVILIGPFQFLKWFRNRFMTWHRISGKIYVFAILIFAAPSGLVMAFYAEGGFWSTIAFLIMGILWYITTLLAVLKIRQKNLAQHQIWMMRSFALTFAAVTLRLLVPLFSEFIENNEELIIISTAWLSWLLNLLVAEGMIFAMNRKTDKLKISI